MDHPQGQFRVMFTPADYSKSVAFYRDGLGLAIDHDWDFGPGDAGTVFLCAAGMIEVFNHDPAVTPVRPVGMGLLVQVDDADRWYALAQERNLPVAEPPISQVWGQRTLRLIDPDGVVVTLFHFLPAQ